MKRITRYTIKLVKESSGNYDVDTIKIKQPQTAVDILNKLYDFDSEAVENFGIIALNTKNSICGVHIITSGTLNKSIVHPREVFQAALSHPCDRIILFHNHPSGDPEPSPEDITVTGRLVEAGELLGISVLDHVVIGHDGNMVSFKERGLL